ncbi:ATP-binding protein [Thermosulfurimonas marina]|uniref:ATP-binding protein n=1 Tax=Thermosulfurimonas marina TaxID=2047767 RepID=A0A6H1WTC9_9BACT|nr:ATP-binding protein [Thermosulfurimonas marina]QJA06404.1 ATP-binding protein [Thermosulfurimonas marina]
MNLLPRYLSQRLPRKAPPRRLVVLTGARQVGKTTLARNHFEKIYPYFNLDSSGERLRLERVPAEAWGRVVGEAVFDEIQKAPSLLEKIKWAYDRREIHFSVLLGSSRILLLKKIQESLAGRVFLYELWPLTVGELAPFYGAAFPQRPILAALVEDPFHAPQKLLELSPVGEEVGRLRATMDHLLTFGGLPTLLEYPPEERFAWLEAYQSTYLERDLADLARLRDLEPFLLCHRLAALRAARIFSYSELARDAGLPVSTVRRYLYYLELSYQIHFLPAWSGNPTTRLIKSPKLIWLDGGLQRVLSGQIEGLTGEQYENVVTGQILSLLRSLGLRFTASYLRTAGGLEIDLILETQKGILALEMKAREKVYRRDATALERSRRLFGDRLRLGLVVYRGEEILPLTDSVIAVPDWFLLGWPFSK